VSDLQTGEFVKWINPVTGGWETGNYVVIREPEKRELFVTSTGIYFREDLEDERLIIQKTCGGLCLVTLSQIERIPDRKEYESE
jgi:hypothetical protein